MRQPKDIAAALAAFDGKHTASLKAVLADDLSPEAEAALIAAIPGSDEVAATWLVKALVEKARLGQHHLATLFDRLPDITKPDAALHLLQCAQYAPDAARLLRPHLFLFYGHDKILLRVWAFDAYCRGADASEDLGDRIRQGLTNRSAAMRARSKALAAEFGIDLENGARPPHLDR
ncbi:hypothetical protein [Hasllibacter sp. MH4015]|uniref:hypothetical protein n=1 Tax=Hasllibacter sp. MH4015 TaxID=2854029 RepID=UPI001CD29215|nr:hypothetical protein [Hasllibacter sp. MH4015]